MEGIKYDDGKLRWDIVPWRELEEVVSVITHGAKKYSPDNWKHVTEERYKAAAMRHLCAYFKGEDIDESGHHHLAHAICSCLFALWHANNKTEKFIEKEFSAIE